MVVVEEAEHVATVLRSLQAATLRVAYLRQYLGDGCAPEVAQVFELLAAARVRAQEREVQLALVMLLASLCEDPALDRLAESAAALELNNLSRLLRRAPAVEPTPSLPPIPDYGAGRELSVGERKAMARRPSRAAFDKLLRDPHPLVIGQLLENPRLTEDDLVRLAARRPANVEAQRRIARTEWLCRPRIRMTLIHNPGTPLGIALPLVAVCTRPELEQLRTSSECPALVRQTAEEFLVLRSLPPPPEGD